MITLNLPLNVHIKRKTGPDKVFTMNLNSYRNTHFHTLNNAKKLYRDLVWDALINSGFTGKRIEGPLCCSYTVYPSSKRKFDLGNVCSIVQKFTEDAMVELHFIEDDNHRVIPIVNYRFGSIDRENPRCELSIESIKK